MQISEHCTHLSQLDRKCHPVFYLSAAILIFWLHCIGIVCCNSIRFCLKRWALFIFPPRWKVNCSCFLPGQDCERNWSAAVQVEVPLTVSGCNGPQQVMWRGRGRSSRCVTKCHAALPLYIRAQYPPAPRPAPLTRACLFVLKDSTVP